MNNKPIYDEKIIVGIIYKNEFNWYIADKYLWIMDLKKYLKNTEIIDKFTKNVINLRKDILILSEKNAITFIHRIEQYKVEVQALKVEIFKEITDNKHELEDYYPLLMIDFDKKCFYSQYPEPSVEFEKYVPDNWNGRYISFIEFIDIDNRYWIYKKVNLFEIN